MPEWEKGEKLCVVCTLIDVKCKFSISQSKLGLVERNRALGCLQNGKVDAPEWEKREKNCEKKIILQARGFPSRIFKQDDGTGNPCSKPPKLQKLATPSSVAPIWREDLPKNLIYGGWRIIFFKRAAQPSTRAVLIHVLISLENGKFAYGAYSNKFCA
jgi:hypothetical protein